MSRVPISISIEKKTIKKIDTSKGKNEPRSRFIEDIICNFLDNLENTEGISPQVNTKRTNSRQRKDRG